MDIFTIILGGGALFYLALLIPALFEADRKMMARERFLPAEKQTGSVASSYWVMVSGNILLILPAGYLSLFAISGGPICGIGGLLMFFAPMTAFFVTITRRPAKSDTRGLRILWRAATYFGIFAVMVGFGAAACSVQQVRIGG